MSAALDTMPARRPAAGSRGAASRRGACPSLSAPMQTGDGLLVRLRPVAGMIPPEQLAGLARAATRHGNGVLEVSARGNLQLRGLSHASAKRLARDVDALGIAPRTGVPVETGPLAGLDPTETADPTRIADAIRTGCAARKLAGRLGPKVTVVINGGGRSGLARLLADIRLEAVRLEKGTAWRLALAGTADSAAMLGILSEEEAPGAALKLLEAVAAHGNSARGRDLLGKPELERLCASLPYLTSHGQRIDLAEADGPDRPMAAAPVGAISLADGRRALGIGLPFGQIEAQALAELAEQAQAAGATEIRLAPGRGLLILVPTMASCDALRHVAKRLGFIVDETDSRLSIVACAGAPACASAFLATKVFAAEFTQIWQGGAFHISGCPKRCAEPTGRLPALIGTADGLMAEPVEGVSFLVARDGLAAALRRLTTAGADE